MVRHWRQAPALTPEAAWDKAVPFINPVAGILASVDPLDLTQAPLCQSAASVRLPGLASVVGAGPDHITARHQALRQGLLTYARALAAGDEPLGALTLDGTLVSTVDVRAFKTENILSRRFSSCSLL
jgi:hypothetical protein